MIRPLALATLIALCACTSPHLNAGLSVGAEGVTISPSVSAGLGGGRISYTP